MRLLFLICLFRTRPTIDVLFSRADSISKAAILRITVFELVVVSAVKSTSTVHDKPRSSTNQIALPAVWLLQSFLQFDNYIIPSNISLRVTHPRIYFAQISFVILLQRSPSGRCDIFKGVSSNRITVLSIN
jgi:hypothetical protein